MPKQPPAKKSPAKTPADSANRLRNSADSVMKTVPFDKNGRAPATMKNLSKLDKAEKLRREATNISKKSKF
jgi:hypothetical protein